MEWLRLAQFQGKIGDCDIEILTSAILWALYNWALTSKFCGHSASAVNRDLYVERFMELLRTGIGIQAISGSRTAAAMV
jgi:hypothetical protein